MLDRRTGGRAYGGTDVTPTLLLLAEFIGTLRRIVGMPDYAAHLEHLRRCHPETSIPTEREFFEEFLRIRYGDSPTRCC